MEVTINPVYVYNLISSDTIKSTKSTYMED